MSRYHVIRTVDILGDEEFLCIPQPEYGEFPDMNDMTPYWFDSPNSWSAEDFINPEIYSSVEIIPVSF